jgi:hypothetical protein
MLDAFGYGLPEMLDAFLCEFDPVVLLRLQLEFQFRLICELPCLRIDPVANPIALVGPTIATISHSSTSPSQNLSARPAAVGSHPFI